MYFKNRIRVFFRYLKYVLCALAVILLAGLFTRFFIIAPGRADGYSMEPFLRDNEFALINKLIYLIRPPKRFEAAQMIEPRNNQIVTKRIIGLPNEIVSISNGRVFIQKNINESPVALDESAYLQNSENSQNFKGEDGNYVVGENQYFVLGDNRAASTDSRHFGAVPRSNILGKIILWSHKR